jgi:hypothetical protein
MANPQAQFLAPARQILGRSRLGGSAVRFDPPPHVGRRTEFHAEHAVIGKCWVAWGRCSRDLAGIESQTILNE